MRSTAPIHPSVTGLPAQGCDVEQIPVKVWSNAEMSGQSGDGVSAQSSCQGNPSTIPGYRDCLKACSPKFSAFVSLKCSFPRLAFTSRTFSFFTTSF